MNNDKNKGQFKSPDNEDYDINNPQNLTKPAYTSDTDKRVGERLPQTENLNQENDENKQLHTEETSDNPDVDAKNDESLTGEGEHTDLGNDPQPDDHDNDDPEHDDPEEDKLIKK
jgi:hypothetical protein